MDISPETFQQQLLVWFDRHGRKDLPWQCEISPYRVWLSETMLQQTQVSSVIPYFQRFIDKFPDIGALAQASIDEVLHSWSGLGYYARARNLHKTAGIIFSQGRFPDTLDELLALPGIGRSTAGAILSIAFNNSHPILDGNVKRVLARYQAIPGWPGTNAVGKQLWALSARLTPQIRVADYTQAIMDLGATVCTRSKPDCAACPLNSACKAHLNNNVLAFPSPKPAKVLPLKRLVFLILCDNEQRFFLEKRPPTGLWGGLWSLPEFAGVDSADRWCAANGLSVIDRRLLAKQRHSFSHYHLEYTPLLIRTEGIPGKVSEADQQDWHKQEQINQLGLPAPIKQLLQQAGGISRDENG